MKSSRAAAALCLALVAAGTLRAQACYSTSDAAAQAAIGAGKQIAGGSTGYRVDDIQFDLVIGRAWMRVRRCENPGAPAVLVPLNVPVASGPRAIATAPPIATPASLALPISPPVAVPVLHAGDPVRVVFSSASVQMQVEGTANAQAALGQRVEVILKRRQSESADEPPHRITGIARADGTVEVQ